MQIFNVRRERKNSCLHQLNKQDFQRPSVSCIQQINKVNRSFPSEVLEWHQAPDWPRLSLILQKRNIIKNHSNTLNFFGGNQYRKKLPTVVIFAWKQIWRISSLPFLRGRDNNAPDFISLFSCSTWSLLAEILLSAVSKMMHVDWRPNGQEPTLLPSRAIHYLNW